MWKLSWKSPNKLSENRVLLSTFIFVFGENRKKRNSIGNKIETCSRNILSQNRKTEYIWISYLIRIKWIFCIFFGLKATAQIKFGCNWLNTKCNRQKHKNFIEGLKFFAELYISLRSTDIRIYDVLKNFINYSSICNNWFICIFLYPY